MAGMIGMQQGQAPPRPQGGGGQIQMGSVRDMPRPRPPGGTPGGGQDMMQRIMQQAGAASMPQGHQQMQMRPGGLSAQMAANPQYQAAQAARAAQMNRIGGQVPQQMPSPVSSMASNLSMAAPLLQQLGTSPMRSPAVSTPPPSNTIPDMEVFLELLRSMGLA